MAPLSATALAPVNTGSGLLLYFQSRDNKIFEVASQDGSSWNLRQEPIVEDCRSWGSPITAYYNRQDADYDDQETVHLLYVNSDNKLIELYRLVNPEQQVKKEEEWTPIPSEVINTHEPTETSHLCSGSVLGSPVIHRVKDQFVYYESQSGSNLNFTELWRNPKSPWYIQTVLPGQEDQEPGTDLTCIIKSAHLRLFVQDHAKNIRMWENIRGWEDKGVQVDQKEVSAQACFAAASVGPSGSDDEHLVFSSSGTPAQIKHFFDDQVSETGVEFWEGTRLGLVNSGDQIILFYMDVHDYKLKTRVYEQGSWKKGVTVVE
ncbi:hypothetical protein BDV25DRAFT_135084 [Aspergillus avenaceus]|uniref:Fucose-specific lectin n=1 Tax=Aspergillus avenaceus TaxID=36643 RepID=A0A5N6U9P6_ASPAV|nr:hypothetical protein BDV25DRAFT_135084 [Aspergillus avenaceus]